MIRSSEVIYLIEHERDVREEISGLLASCGMNVISFGSAASYLNHVRSDESACLILEMHLPDINGLDLQQQLADGARPPIVFLCGSAFVRCAVRAMKSGAIDVLTKPVEPVALMAAVKSALAEDAKLRQRNADLANVRRRFSSLTPREQEVLSLVVDGMANKQAAAFLGIADVTLQVHRGQIMRKMAAGSLADLVRMAGKLNIPNQQGIPLPMAYPIRPDTAPLPYLALGYSDIYTQRASA